MPLPTPRKGQSQDSFVDSCMGNSVMNREFPKANQRKAVCHSQFRKTKRGRSVAGAVKKGPKK